MAPDPSNLDPQPKVEIPAELVGKTWILRYYADVAFMQRAEKIANPTRRLRFCENLANLATASTVLPALFCLLCSWGACSTPFYRLLAYRAGEIGLADLLASFALFALWASTCCLILKCGYEYYRHHYVRLNVRKLRKRGLIRRFVGLAFREGTAMQFDGLDDSYRSIGNRIVLGLLADLSFAGFVYFIATVTTLFQQ